MFTLMTTGDAQNPPAVLGIYLLDMITGKLHMELGLTTIATLEPDQGSVVLVGWTTM